MATITSSASRERFRYLGEPIGLEAPRPAPSFDERALAILTARCPPYRAATEELARKERELGLVFAAVPRGEARVLQFRLTACAPGDELARAFARLSLERRARLLAVLFYVRRPTGSTR
jgi:hypothetical protein